MTKVWVVRKAFLEGKMLCVCVAILQLGHCRVVSGEQRN